MMLAKIENWEQKKNIMLSKKVGTRRERTGMGRKEKRERRCEDSEKIEHMRRNVREKEKGVGRNME
ncbi:hypothetical protein GEV33_000619 [Tenebrio molitor]|uniref:Uncharacterized protein n=1 Tax=Tenebrio molitor TaxID=7067 RepID=A0A8J6LKQ9_TENMO|nr:hypothetical protein GEV33_000619 [Tenebrio molitor]